MKNTLQQIRLCLLTQTNHLYNTAKKNWMQYKADINVNIWVR